MKILEVYAYYTLRDKYYEGVCTLPFPYDAFRWENALGDALAAALGDMEQVGLADWQSVEFYAAVMIVQDKEKSESLRNRFRSTKHLPPVFEWQVMGGPEHG